MTGAHSPSSEHPSRSLEIRNPKSEFRNLRGFTFPASIRQRQPESRNLIGFTFPESIRNRQSEIRNFTGFTFPDPIRSLGSPSDNRQSPPASFGLPPASRSTGLRRT